MKVSLGLLLVFLLLPLGVGRRIVDLSFFNVDAIEALEVETILDTDERAGEIFPELQFSPPIWIQEKPEGHVVSVVLPAYEGPGPINLISFLNLDIPPPARA